MNTGEVRRSFDAKNVYTSRQQCDCIGRGSYGKVYKVYTRKLGCAAAKVITVTGTLERHSDLNRVVQNEAEILALANHENIVRFHGVACWSHYFAIIMDYEAGGSLHDLLKCKTVTVLPWKLRFRFISETVNALVYLHNSGLDDRIVHGDLKSCNILLNEDLHVRVGDFGAAILATKTCDQTNLTPEPNSRVHTVVFSAPEFLSDVFATRATAMDIYSLGRVIYEVITRLTPFQDETFDNITDAIVSGAIPSEAMIPRIRQNLVTAIDEDLQLMDLLVHVMHGCCKFHALERPNIVQIQESVGYMMKQIPSVAVMHAVRQVVNQMSRRPGESSPESRILLHDLTV